MYQKCNEFMHFEWSDIASKNKYKRNSSLSDYKQKNNFKFYEIAPEKMMKSLAFIATIAAFADA